MKYLLILCLAFASCSSEDSDPAPSAACLEITQLLDAANKQIANYHGTDRQVLADMRTVRDQLIVRQHNECK